MRQTMMMAMVAFAVTVMPGCASLQPGCVEVANECSDLTRHTSGVDRQAFSTQDSFDVHHVGQKERL